jgi:transcription initiation factor IIE alpha subunit
VLGGFTGEADALLSFHLAKGYAERTADFEQSRIERHAYLGRYWGLTPHELEAMPASLVRRYVDALSAIIKRENGPSTVGEK